MELKCMNDLFKYLESKFDRKITEAEKGQIRLQMVILGKSAKEILESLLVDYSDAVIR